MDLIDHLHPSVVHFPIALLLVSSATGLVYLFFWPRVELRLITWVSMALGWIACGAAILSGLLAQSGLSPQAPYRSVLNLHIGTGLAALVLYGSLLYQMWRLRGTRAQRERERRGLPAVEDLLDDRSRRWLTALLLAAGAVLVGLTGFNGGQLVYVWGVNVMQ